MKLRIVLALMIAGMAFGQMTAVTVNVNMKTTHLASWQSWIIAHPSAFTSKSQGAILLADTTITLASAADAANCSPKMLTPDAPIGAFCSILLPDTGEVASVTAIVGAVLTVNRGTLGTTAAAHLAGAVIQILQYRNANHLAQTHLARLNQSILDSMPPSTIATQQAAIVTAEAAIAAEKKVGVQ